MNRPSKTHRRGDDALADLPTYKLEEVGGHHEKLNA